MKSSAPAALAFSAYAAISLLSVPFTASALTLSLTSIGIALILLIASRILRPIPIFVIKQPLNGYVTESAIIPFKLQNGEKFNITRGFKGDICRKFVKLSINDVCFSTEQLQNDTEENRNHVIAEVLEDIYSVTHDKAKTERIVAYLDQGLAGELLSQFLKCKLFINADHEESPFSLQAQIFYMRRELRFKMAKKKSMQGPNAIQRVIVLSMP